MSTLKVTVIVLAINGLAFHNVGLFMLAYALLLAQSITNGFME